ncbi:ABC transporter permease [Acetobacterium tundrae]|uniref:ABC transporter permease n=1 Tax=Acetobacterium tundrae TaxID=132932 RepID=A0ABR6WKB4_9FIRM|nr:ABC transporter permease [Acetobacterium tundrae]MBC3796950.1 ABC transporter permease [Acetobacterium tundrae]
MSLVIGSLQLGLIYSLIAMGIYISFKVLNIPDLTAEGSFTFGMAVMAVCVTGGHPILGIFLSLLAGAAAGLVTALLHTKLRIPAILSGILTMTGLYTINLMVMGGSSNLTLLGVTTIYDMVGGGLPLSFTIAKILISLIVAVVMIAILVIFFKTNCGLCIRAIGDNEEMARSSSMSVDLYKTMGLMVSNALIGLCGGLIACDQGYADMTSGAGMLVIGLAAVIIGEAFIRRRTIFAGLMSCVLGSIIYRLILAVAVSTRIFPAYAMKLLSAIIVAIALAIPAYQYYKENYQLKKRNKHA